MKTPTIQELRAKNVKCRVSHFRFAELDKNSGTRILYPLGLLKEMARERNEHIISPKGGLTMLSILKDGKEHTAIARCHEKDTFNKKVSLSICIQRVMQKVNI